MDYVILGSLYNIEIDGVKVSPIRKLLSSLIFGEEKNNRLFIHSEYLASDLETAFIEEKLNTPKARIFSITYKNLTGVHYKHDFENPTTIELLPEDLLVIKGKKLVITNQHIEG